MQGHKPHRTIKIFNSLKRYFFKVKLKTIFCEFQTQFEYLKYDLLRQNNCDKQIQKFEK